ncbi:MAG TPA: hypothetical protein VKF37_18150 [Chloroflexota bacterium]|nr:hypothetical protein [Chloroflexota bacterium]
MLFAFSLCDGGYLMLGTGDPTRPPPEFVAPAHRQLSIVRRHGEPLLIRPLQIRTSVLSMRCMICAGRNPGA